MELLEKCRMCPQQHLELGLIQQEAEEQGPVLSVGRENQLQAQTRQGRSWTRLDSPWAWEVLGAAQGQNKQRALGGLDKPKGWPSRGSGSGNHRNMGIFPGKPGSIRE